MPPRTATPAPAGATREITWVPHFSTHVYRSDHYDRIQYLIDVPLGFSGKKGAFKLSIENKGTELVLTVPFNAVHTDLHHIHSYLTENHGRIFSEDSSKANSFKESAKALLARSSDKKKVVGVFRDKTPFRVDEKVADDLSHNGILHEIIEMEHPKTKRITKANVLIIELKSHKKVEVEEPDDSDEDDLKEPTTFKSPQKLHGISGGETHQIAKVMEMLAKSGISMETFLNQGSGKRSGRAVQDDDMDIDGAGKRGKAGPKTTGKSD